MSDPDVAVYGGTAAGVIAARQAAELGAAVVLVAPERHLGGMASGGLGKTDMERQGQVIGGAARRFYEAVGVRYGEPIAWRFEPHVAEAVFDELADHPRISVRLDARLTDVTRSANAIAGATFSDGAMRAGCWIDATYEGDLMAAAGVSHGVGREDRSLHGESLAGRRELLPGPHQFVAAARATDAGALAALIQPLEAIGLPGSGDGKLQSFCYRICLTTDLRHATPLDAPPGHDPRSYDLLVAYLEALGDRATLRHVLGIGQLPNGKTDVNSDGAISTNLLGASWGYVEADAAGRAAIAAEHERWARGLLHVLAHDPRIPATMRDEMRRYGMPSDEFRDTDGWPHQLYVREARRMRGEYLLTQRDLTVDRQKPDAIGMGGYNIDIREVQWVAAPVSRFPDVADEVLTEGYLSQPVEPWQIPYRALLPTRDECTNLIVPVCISASHVAFNGFRLEPQYMIAGHAAGVAAALAAREGIAAHDVPIDELQQRLRAAGQVLELG